MNIEGVNTVPSFRPAELMPGAEPQALPQEREGGQEEAMAPVAQSTDASGVIQFSPDPVSGKMRIQVVNPDSGEVVRQIPHEDLVAISRMLGILFDRVA